MPEYVRPALPYDFSALEPAMSGQILELLHSKHHADYVKGANDTMEQLAEARAGRSLGGLVGLEKTLAFHVSGRVPHSLFWQNLSPDGGDRQAANSRRRGTEATMRERSHCSVRSTLSRSGCCPSASSPSCRWRSWRRPPATPSTGSASGSAWPWPRCPAEESHDG